MTSSSSEFGEAHEELSSADAGNSRFAGNQITTAGDVSALTVTVTSAFGNRVAAATTNRTEEASLRRAVQTSEELARLVPDDPEYMGELEPREYVQPDAVFPATAALTPGIRAQAVRAVTEVGAERKLSSTGFATHETGSFAVATSKGLFAHHAASRANFTTTVRTPDGTGREIDAAALGRIAAEMAEASRKMRAPSMPTAGP